MRTGDAPLAARTRGLALHLFGRDELERWAALPDVATLGKALQDSGGTATPLPLAPTAADIDEAMQRTAAAALAVFARWAGSDSPLLQWFEAEQERRSLRALLRGAVEGAPADERLAGLLPTSRLTPARLNELAHTRAPRELALRLLVYGDPRAAALIALTASPRVDLLQVELALARRLAEDWQQALARADAALRDSSRERVDVFNAVAALELAGAAGEFDIGALFIEGGAALARGAFAAAARAPHAVAAARAIAQAFTGSPLAHLFRPPPESAVRLDDAALTDRIERLRRRCRIEPLGSAPAQWYLARLDAQQRDLRRLAWGLQLGLPPPALREKLLTP